MAKLPRVTNKMFGKDIALEDIGQFGSAATGEHLNTKDIPTIQGLDAWNKGWSKATMSNNKYPTRQERNGMDYAMSYQIDYMLREGIFEYDGQTEYNKGSIVKKLGLDNKVVLYQSLIDENIGQSLDNVAAWEELKLSGGGLEIGDIGIAPLGIDETKGKRRYLNGQLIIQEQYVQFTNKVKSAIALYPSLACTESEWQTTATMTVGGQVGKFVVDNDAGTIRLPKIIMPIQGLTDLSKLGEIVEAGLPNITGTFTTLELGYHGHEATSGALYSFSGNTGGVPHGGNGTSAGLGIDASRSSSIYGNSNTVQQEQIQYPYFIQVATGAETEDNIINEIELNNPYSLGDSKYSPQPLNNLSWLKSEGQWNSKATYPSFYDWALINLNNGVEGFASSTGEYTDYDVVINPAEETFRLPLLDGSESLPSDRYDELILGVSGTTYTAPANGWYILYKQANSPTSSTLDLFCTLTNDSTGITSHFHGAYGFGLTPCVEVKKGDVARATYDATGVTQYFRFVYAQGNGSLYFYVGETVQNANLINAGRIEEKLASLISDNSNLIASYATLDISKMYQTTERAITILKPSYVSFYGQIGAYKPAQINVNGVYVTSMTNPTNSAVYIGGASLLANKGDVITFGDGFTSSTLTTTIIPLKGVKE